jgi:Asparagine synthase
VEGLSPYEVATAFPLGTGARGPSSGSNSPRRPGPEAALAALETVVLEALRRPPCFVQFSGGRDSSAVLAVAALVARRSGLPLPVPLTVRFPTQPEAGEDDWQELVINHLHLPDWERLDGGENADVLGPAAQAVLRRYGVIWSPLLATRVPFMAPAAGGSLLTGEGGDEVLGPRRCTPLAGLAGVRQFSRGARLARASLGALLPKRERQARSRRQFTAKLGLEWLQGDVRQDFLHRSASQLASEPLGWAGAVEWVTSCRHVQLGLTNMKALAAEVGVALEAPLLHPSFVGALGGAFGYLGPKDRTTAMRALFGSLLPDQLLSRRTKAVFTLTAWGPRTREFVAGWPGTGLDPDLVDVDALHRHWAGPRPSAMTFGLAQAAWLATAA